MSETKDIEYLKERRKQYAADFARMLLRSEGNVSGLDIAKFALTIERLNTQIDEF